MNAHLCHAFHYIRKYTQTLLSLYFCLSVTPDCKPIHDITQMLLDAGARVNMKIYSLALQGNEPEHLPMILEHFGLPQGYQLELAQRALSHVNRASYWLPLLLKAGMDPMLLLDDQM